ncbi:hypothetical protein A9Q84_03710 [Halobacteriovorax marinus]|uniref:Response regulatory domain-containing protein n=1 Tax=Halobacteriovorax marinus TaxID=97084 RepID=A0A1Y5FA37_9BACT|nr:hypothetical protein A9Q84_03710 [Halobacteriovorax marinus]
MIFEDMDPKVVANINNFLGDKKALIVDARKTSKSTVKKMLVASGVKMSHIFNATSLSDARDIIIDLKIDIVITASEVQKEKGMKLIEDHQKVFPNRSAAIFILMSEANSPASACAILDTEIDDYLAEPFTAKSLAENFINIVQKKMETSNFLTFYHRVKEHIFLNKLDEAEDDLLQLMQIEDYLDETFYLEGLINKKHGDFEKSLLSFKKSVEVNPRHYLSLQELIDGHTKLKQYAKAYEFSFASLKNYPIDPEKLPNLIRLSLTNQKYEDLIRYAKFFSSLDEQCPATKTSIAASLVLCSKYFFNNDNRKQGIQTLLEAVKASSGKLSILHNIIETFIANKESKLAYEILNKFSPLHGKNPIFKLLEIEICFILEDVQTVLTKGIPLAESGHANKKVFEAVIVSSIKTDRKKSSIENLIDKAQTKFPDSIDYFSSLYKK